MEGVRLVSLRMQERTLCLPSVSNWEDACVGGCRML